MKHTDISDLTVIGDKHFENLFNVYDDGVYYYNLLRTVNMPENLDPSTYFLLKLDRSISLTALSHRIYGSINLWWLICIANNINDTVRPIEVGTVLKIILPEHVNSIVETLKSR